MKFFILNSKAEKIWFDSLNEVAVYARRYSRNNSCSYSVYDMKNNYICAMGKRNGKFRVRYPQKK